jgi:hypothetical protein
MGFKGNVVDLFIREKESMILFMSAARNP